jgi:phosphoglucomutase
VNLKGDFEMDWYSTYLQWKNNENLDKDILNELHSSNSNMESLEDSFSKNIEFGTAGMRGIMGPGTNRINIYTIRLITEGLARYIVNEGVNAVKRGVVICYDSRHNSYLFAIEAAKILVRNGIKVYLFDDIRPTPELSFSVRSLNSYAGIMITASHNPSNYNGYKLFGEDGGQIEGETIEIIRSHVNNVKNIFDISTLTDTQLMESIYFNSIGKDIDSYYFEAVRSVIMNKKCFDQNKTDIKVVYTPLHGCGGKIIRRFSQEIGFDNLLIVPEQELPDPNFSTVVSPNPEDPAAFDMAIKLGKKVKADILIATDPDSDRIGIAVATKNGNFNILSGNQLALIMLKFILESFSKQNKIPDNAYIVKSIVSTDLAQIIAESFGVTTQEVPIGFKNIAKVISKNSSMNNKHFLFGFEESNGYLIKPFVRDKDAIQAFILILEITSYYKSLGLTLNDVLFKIYDEYGYYNQKTISIPLNYQSSTLEDTISMLRIKNYEPFKTLFNPVIEDYSFQRRISPKGKISKIEIEPNETLKFYFNNFDWVAIRQSGTEPILKVYAGTKGRTLQEADTHIEKLLSVVRETINLLVRGLL